MSLASVTFLFISYDVQVSEIRKEHNFYDDLFSGSSCIGTVEWQQPLFSLDVIDNIQYNEYFPLILFLNLYII